RYRHYRRGFRRVCSGCSPTRRQIREYIMQNTTSQAQENLIEQTTTTCCIVGGGPGGAVLGLALARRGIPVTLLESHMDFDRAFRGDVIYPSTLTIMDELGLIDRVRALHHTKRSQIVYELGNTSLVMADLSYLKTNYPYIAMINQAELLELVTSEAKTYPHFRMLMGARMEELLKEQDTVCGVRYRTPDG